MIDTPLIRIDRHESGVVEVVLDRPEAMNAVSTQMATALTAAGGALADDTSVRAVVLTSSHDKAFCVGADLKERNGFTDEQLRAQRPGNRLAYRALLDLPVPTIAAVIPSTPASTPRRAVFGELSHRSDRMKRIAATK